MCEQSVARAALDQTLSGCARGTEGQFMKATSDRKIRLRFVMAFAVLAMLAGSFEFVRRATEQKLSLALGSARSDAALEHVRSAISDVQIALIQNDGSQSALANLHAKQVQLVQRGRVQWAVAQQDASLREPAVALRALIDSFLRQVEEARRNPRGPAGRELVSKVAARIISTFAQIEHPQPIAMRTELD